MHVEHQRCSFDTLRDTSWHNVLDVLLLLVDILVSKDFSHSLSDRPSWRSVLTTGDIPRSWSNSFSLLMDFSFISFEEMSTDGKVSDDPFSFADA